MRFDSSYTNLDEWQTILIAWSKIFDFSIPDLQRVASLSTRGQESGMANQNVYKLLNYLHFFFLQKKFGIPSPLFKNSWPFTPVPS